VTADGGRDARIADLINRHVDDAIRPFLLGPDKHGFAPADLEGAVVYGRAGGVLVCVGDPIGPDGWTAFDRLAGAAKRRHLTLGVYQATADGSAALEARDWQTVPVGLEAILDLPSFSLAGSRRANLRHTITRAARGGVQVTWHPDGMATAAPDVLAALVGLDREWRRHAGPAMGFTITRFCAESLVGTPVAVAWAGPQPVAFATFRRCGACSYVLDVMRRRDGGTPGALESCVARAATELGASAGRLSLGLTALAGLDPAAASRNERWLARGADAVSGVYDVAGLAFFKGKFDPAWQPRYLAFRAGSLPVVAGGLLWLHLVDAAHPLPAVAADLARGLVDAGRTQVGSVGWPRGVTLRARRDPRRESLARMTPMTTASASDGLAASRVTGRQRATLALLSSAAVVGGAAFGGRVGRRGVVGLAIADGLFVAWVGLGSRRSRAQFADAQAPTGDPTRAPTGRAVTVLVAARNEEQVLPDLIGDLARQDLRQADGSPAFDVIVVDDRSTDQTLHRTLAAARHHGIEPVVSVRARRGRQLPDGKGAALRHVPLDECADLILVLDADARLGPTVLADVARLSDRGAGLDAWTLRRRSIAPAGSWLGACQGDELAVDAVVEEARWAFGRSGEFRGNGMVVRRNVLARAGGWRDALTEDIDLSARLAATPGTRGIAWPPQPVITEQAVLAPGDLWRQRVRWAEGTVRAWLEWSPRLVESRGRSPSVVVERMAYAAQLLVPLAAAGAAVGGLRARRLRGALAIPAAYFAAVAAIGSDAIGREPGTTGVSIPARSLRGLRVAAFMSLWFAATPVGMTRVLLARGPIRYHATTHSRG
jgi:hypothetical protein